MRMRRHVLSGLALGALTGCSQEEQPAPEAPAATVVQGVSVAEQSESTAAETAGEAGDDSQESAPLVFTTLVTRSHKITISMGEDGPLYTVAMKEGEVLAELIDEAELQEKFPDIHEMIHNAADFGECGYGGAPGQRRGLGY